MSSIKALLPAGAVFAAVIVAIAGAGPRPEKSDAVTSTSNNTPTDMVQVRFLDDKGLPGPLTPSPKVVKTDAEWKKQLTADQYAITRGKGTEPAFCGAFFDQHKPGVYFCY